MAQTTTSVSNRSYIVEVSTDGSAWSDISGSSSAVEDMEQERESGEAYTQDGDTAIIQTGKRKPIEPKVKLVYTPTTGEGFELVRAAFEAGTALYLRVAPAGAATGKARFTSGAGWVTKFTYPPLDTEDGKPIMVGFTMKVPSMTRALIP